MSKPAILAAAVLAMLPAAIVAQDGLGLVDVASPELRVLDNASRPEAWEQVRIEERVIIRVSPSAPDNRQQLQALQLRRANPDAYREINHDGCVRAGNIIGVQPTDDNRLLLFMQNRNVLAASLQRGCDARAFYSGFYVERSDDGQLCVDRDQLHSRAGVSCALDTMRRLVPVDDD